MQIQMLYKYNNKYNNKTTIYLTPILNIWDISTCLILNIITSKLTLYPLFKHHNMKIQDMENLPEIQKKCMKSQIISTQVKLISSRGNKQWNNFYKHKTAFNHYMKIKIKNFNRLLCISFHRATKGIKHRNLHSQNITGQFICLLQ